MKVTELLQSAATLSGTILEVVRVYKSCILNLFYLGVFSLCSGLTTTHLVLPVAFKIIFREILYVCCKSVTSQHNLAVSVANFITSFNLICSYKPSDNHNTIELLVKPHDYQFSLVIFTLFKPYKMFTWQVFSTELHNWYFLNEV